MAALENFGGRRFVLTVFAGISATALQWLGKLDPAGNSYMLIVIGTVAAYITGDTTQRVKDITTAGKAAQKDAP